MKKNKSNVVNICLALLLLLQALLLPVICSAEQMYQITETELTELEQNSSRQLAISSQLAAELQIAKERLKVSDQELTEAKLQKELLQKQLTELEASSKNQENLQKEILKSLPPSAAGVLREVGLKIDIDRYPLCGCFLFGNSHFINLRNPLRHGQQPLQSHLVYAPAK